MRTMTIALILLISNALTGTADAAPRLFPHNATQRAVDAELRSKTVQTSLYKHLAATGRTPSVSVSAGTAQGLSFGTVTISAKGPLGTGALRPSKERSWALDFAKDGAIKRVILSPWHGMQPDHD